MTLIKTKKDDGTALTELAILMPFLLLLLAGVFNFASFMWQVQVISEASRHAARTGAFYSAQYAGTPCSDVVAEARNQFQIHMESYEQKNNKSELSKNWEISSICLTTLAWSNTADRYITVSVDTKDSENCVLCFNGFFSKLQDNYTSSFIMPQACTGEAFFSC